jgi:cytoskeletal protein CcmA (bactofilin family)
MSNPYDTGDDKKTSILGPTLKFKGELSAEEDLLIQGKVEGSIKHTSSLTIGDQGNIKANIKAEHIAVEGKVKGDIRGSKSVVVKDSGNVDGNIFSPTVTLVEGATFNGSIDMSDKAESERQRPEPAAKAEDAKTAEVNEIALEPAKKASGSAKKSASAA